MKRLFPAILAAWFVIRSAWSAAAANDLNRDEEVVFFPTAVAYDDKSPETTLFVHGWVFEPETDSTTRAAALAGVAKLCGFGDDEQQSALFRDRAGRFLVDNERDQQLVLRLGSRNVTLSPTEPNGHVRAKLKLPTAEVRKLLVRQGAAPPTVEFQVVTRPGDARVFRGRVHLIAAEGWSVVSDVDDTIKDSNVLDKQELLRNTFLRDFKPVDGMAAVYRKWSAAGAAFHYVSGSPWQLYSPLAAFAADEKFPPGAWQLRYARLQDGSALQLLQPPEVYKRTTIQEILRTFPRRKFILVGDTGEQDPEAYGHLARQFPEQVRLVALRNITQETLDGTRLSRALGGVPPERIVLFRTVEDLPQLDAIK